MAFSNINISSVRLSSRRSGEPFSSLVVVDGYYHCFFCDLMTEFEKKGVAAPGLKCGPCGVEGIMYRGCWNKKRRCTNCQLFCECHTYIFSRRFHCGHRKKQNLALVVKKLVSVLIVVRFSETAKIVISSPNYRLKKMWMMMKKNFNLFGTQ